MGGESSDAWLAGLVLHDAHLHLQDERLPPAVRDQPVAGLASQLVNGTGPADWAAVEALADTPATRRLKAYGVHPWKVDPLPPDWLARLRGYLASGAVSVGEIGLDRWVEPRDEAVQARVLLAQLQLAREYGLPPTLHCLRAWGPLLELLERSGPLPRGFLVHAAAAPPEVLRRLVRLGGFFSFSAYAADPRRQRLREAIAACPAERLLIETDAPDMAPPAAACAYPLQAQGRALHHPAEIRTAYALVASLRGSELAAVAEQVARNHQRLFGPL